MRRTFRLIFPEKLNSLRDYLRGSNFFLSLPSRSFAMKKENTYSKELTTFQVNFLGARGVFTAFSVGIS